MSSSISYLPNSADLLPPLDLYQRFAELDPLTGKWKHQNDRLRKNVASKRAEETIEQVYKRLQRMNETKLASDGLRLLSHSAKLIEEYRHYVVSDLKREVIQHIRHISAIH